MGISGMYLLALSLCSALALGQQSNTDSGRQGPAPIYRVTVEKRSIRAVNYGHRSEPTRIDFSGTVLLPMAKGGAKVESRAGAVEIDARFENLEPPTRFGTEYLTYVLWAITPEGRPVNLGEIVADGSNKGKLKVTTQFQAFGLIVTAEPYFAVSQPGNIVVLENMLRPDTAGKVEEVEAKYELLPRRGDEVAAKSVELQSSSTGGKPIPQNQYEAVVALYQAQNALQIARSQGADRYAADTMRKAEELFRQAQSLKDDNAQSKRVVMMAREVAQTAEDARTIAMKRNQAEQQGAAVSR